MLATIKLDEKEKPVIITGFPKGIARLGSDGSMKLIPGNERDVTIDEFTHINEFWKKNLQHVKITLVNLKP